MRRIKNRGKLKKEGLINSSLKSESSNAERNYMKHFNINTNVDNRNNNSNDDDDTNDDKIRDKISDIRAMLCRLGNIVTKNYRKKFKKELYEIEYKKNLSDKEKERSSFKENYKCYESRVDIDKKISIEQ